MQFKYSFDFFKFKKLIKNAKNYVLNKNSLIKSKLAASAEVDFALKLRALGIGWIWCPPTWKGVK